MTSSAAKLGPFSFARVLWQHRELLWQFSLREVELRHKGSHLGLIWSVLNPLLMLCLYVFVFGYIFGGRFGILPNETRVDYALGVFLGLSMFQFLAETIALSPNLIVANPNFVKKVVFPLEILPASAVSAATFHLLISLGLVLLGVMLFGPGLSAGVLWLPVIMFPIAMLALGLAWCIAAFGVFLRDLTQVMQFVSMSLMYASAIFYPAHKVPGAIWSALRFNPLLLAIEEARNAVLWDHAVNLKHVGYLYATGLLACSLGYVVFRRLKPAFADVI
ncbi:MAG TPA: ABC transporter permease [Opitutaceae bacterium]|nr:ABC transporter permease [Opitutaceae bacterium]HND61281.1 ABC transporter permease [Opitutaceae bacterium]